MQSLSGTGSIRLMAEFQVWSVKRDRVHYPIPEAKDCNPGGSFQCYQLNQLNQLTRSTSHALKARFMPGSKIYISVPTWGNHHNIYQDAGVERGTYRCGAGSVWRSKVCQSGDTLWTRWIPDVLIPQ